MKHLLIFALAALALATAGGAAETDLPLQMQKVADWQIAHPPTAKGSAPTTGWVMGAFYAGVSTLDRSGLAGKKYHPYLLSVGERNGWKLGARVYHSDDICVGQTYLDLYDTDHDPRMLAAMKQRLDYTIAHPMDDNLAFVGVHKNDRWSWCDCLFMAPPGWVHLSQITGNPAYLDYTLEHWRKSHDYLFDKAEHLYYRDSTYFKKREPNGQKMFWSRGNGWVLAGIARLLEHLRADHPARAGFEAEFREIAARVQGLQLPNGSWAASLLDPSYCSPRYEASGTGFYCYGFAWGVNHGLLPAEPYAASARRAWAFLQTCIEPSGRENHVQPIGAAPSNFPADSTEAYGPGSFLLAGTEIYRLGGG